MTQTYGQTGTQTYGQTGTQTYGQSATHSHNHGHTHEHTQHHDHGALHVLDDRDILTDLLLCAKQLLSAYGTAAIESTNPQLRQTLQHIAKTEGEFHKQVFEMMQQRGWYETPRSDAQLARQIASVWNQQMHRNGGTNQYASHQGPTNQQQAYGTQAPTQSWQGQQRDGTAWQQGWSGQGQTGGAPWQAGQAAAKAWEPTSQSGSGTSPGAHT